MKTLQRKSIVNKMLQFGVMTFASRMLGLLREILQARYLGVGILSDAFIIALKLPLSLRKIFAEGAMSSAFVPVFVKLIHSEKKEDAASLMSLTFIFFQSILIALCLFVFAKPEAVLKFVVPGFSPEQISYSIKYLKILIPFIVFISSSALLAAGLNSIGHFLIPSAGPVLLNIFFIGGLILGIKYNLPIDFLCYTILLSGVILFAVHLFVYIYYGLSFGKYTKSSYVHFKKMLVNSFPVFIAMGIVEINLFLDTAFSSYLSPGTVSILTYSFRFMQIPLGVFGVAFSTILLPHFSKVTTYAPSRLGFYIYESMKFIFWICMPATALMSIFARQIFSSTLVMSGNFPADRLFEAQMLLIIFSLGLFIFSFTKILQNAFYSLQNTFVPMIASIVATIINFVLNFLLMKAMGVYGLAIATIISSIVQMIILIHFLQKKYGLDLYLKDFFTFAKRYTLQFIYGLTAFLTVYAILIKIMHTLPEHTFISLTEKAYFWLWMSPLFTILLFYLLKYRRKFGVKIYFID